MSDNLNPRLWNSTKILKIVCNKFYEFVTSFTPACLSKRHNEIEHGLTGNFRIIVYRVILYHNNLVSC